MGKSSNSRVPRLQVQAPAGFPDFKFTSSLEVPLPDSGFTSLQILPSLWYIQPLEGAPSISRYKQPPEAKAEEIQLLISDSLEANSQFQYYVLLNLRTTEAETKGQLG